MPVEVALGAPERSQIMPGRGRENHKGNYASETPEHGQLLDTIKVARLGRLGPIQSAQRENKHDGRKHVRGQREVGCDQRHG